MLQQARDMGDYLVVGVNSDLSVKALKGVRRPINNQEDRKALLKALRCVDFVQIFHDVRASRFLEVACPHIYVKSGDYSVDSLAVAERQALKKMGTQLKFTKLVPGISTTSILKKI
jgi:rfaE bifunctional protein nucleotidyltransferase chain/domain